MLIYEPKVNFLETKQLEMVDRNLGYDSFFYAFGEDLQFYQIVHRCLPELFVYPELATTINSISILFSTLTILLYFCLERLRKHPLRQHWITFSALSILNCLILIVHIFVVEIDFEALNNRSLIHFVARIKQMSPNSILGFAAPILDFLVYIWLIFICLEIFLSTR
jgi:hypothetical protein